MGHIAVGNAPCSWGTLEFEGLDANPIGYTQMLNELVETGFGVRESARVEEMLVELARIVVGVLHDHRVHGCLEAVTAGVPARLKAEDRHRHDIGAVQCNQTVRRPHATPR